MTPVGIGRNGAKLWDSIEALNRIYAPKIIKNGDGGNGDGIPLDYSDERALLAKEQRLGQELKNARERGELIPTKKVKEIWGRIITSAKQQFLALPDRLVQILETTESSHEQRLAIDKEIKNILVGLSVAPGSYKDGETGQKGMRESGVEENPNQMKLF